MIGPREAKSLDTDALRAAFLADRLFVLRETRLIYTHYDRLIVGGIAPIDREIFLPAAKETGNAHFLDRREMVVVNIGGDGQVVTLTGTYTLARRDMIYLGRGIGPVSFASVDATRPARFYLVSAPAHREFPSRLVRAGEAVRIDHGSMATASARVTFRYVHSDLMETCQLAVGMTVLAEGSVWCSEAGELHARRSEARLYLGIRPDQRVFHIMGDPSETRHIAVANEQAVVSPPWSMQAAVGTQNYAFIWASAGDNSDETDVDPVPLENIR